MSIPFTRETEQPTEAELDVFARERCVSLEVVPWRRGGGVLVRITHPARWTESEVAVVVDALRRLYRR